MPVAWRALLPSDVPAAEALSRLAGWNQTEADWQGYLEFEPGGCLAVETDGRLIGTATTIRYGGQVGWIGMVLVHPDHRRLSLGTQLLGRSLEYLASRGTPSIKLDATPMGRKVYLPLGFRDEGEVTRYQGVVPALPGENAGTAPMAGFPSAALADLDAEAFGVRREQVLASLRGRRPELCFVARAASGAAGLLIARECREAIQLGPWVARDPALAESLLLAFFRAAEGRKVFLDVPASNPAGHEIIRRHGFAVQRGFTRMYLGDPGPPGRPEMVYGTSGAEKG